MAACLDCTKFLTDEEILRLVAVCDETGQQIAWRTKEVSFSGDCVDCSQYLTASERLRNSLWCDEDGLFYIQIVIYELASPLPCLNCNDALTIDEIANLTTVCDENGSVAFKIVLTDYENECTECGDYDTPSIIVRKAIVCDDSGNMFININSSDSPSPPDFECTNILLNSGFEQWVAGEGGDILLNWNNLGGDKNAIQVHDGDYSLMFNGGAANQDFTPDTTCLTISLWYKTDTDKCAVIELDRVNTGVVEEMLQDDGSWSGNYNIITLPTTEGVWVNYTLEFNTTAGLPHTLYIGTFASCSAYFDDVEICSNCE